eukprot:GILI01004471.1.p1 GENE.GILI01004471.1~~GILI01004471.1.p1  ORF type:complete len:250 (-),score=77.47 GILI01004471.1:190-939(-)
MRVLFGLLLISLAVASTVAEVGTAEHVSDDELKQRILTSFLDMDESPDALLAEAEALEGVAHKLRGSSQKENNDAVLLETSANDKSWLSELGILAGVFHKGMAIPWHQAGSDKSYGECAIGIKLAPAFCRRSTFMNFLPCSESSDCQCTACEDSNGAIPTSVPLIQMPGSNIQVTTVWRPYCHNRGIPYCTCGLVALWRPKTSSTWFNLNRGQCYSWRSSKFKGRMVNADTTAFPYRWNTETKVSRQNV